MRDVRHNMRFDMKEPCEHCPFLRGQVYLNRGRVEEIVRSLTVDQQSFPCHKTTVEDPSNESEMMATPDSQHCAGAMIFLESLGKPNQMMRIAERIGMYDRHRLAQADVYENLPEMASAHGEDDS